MSSRRRVDVHRHHERTHEQNQLQNTKLDTLATKLDSVITNTNDLDVNTDQLEGLLTDGTQIAKVMGSEDGSTGGTQRQVHVDSSGNLQTNVVNDINVAPSNSTNSHVTDDPANSVAVGLKARTTIGTATTEQFLLCDSDGHLAVDVVSTAAATGSATEAKQDTIITGLTNITNNTAPINDSEVHLSAIDTNIVTMGSNIASMKIFNQDAELHLSALDTNIANRLPTTIGPKDESLSLTIARNNTTGGFDNHARTNITDRATSKALLCNSLGHLNVSQKKTYTSEASYITSQSVSGSGGTHEGSVVNNDASITEYIFFHNFSGSDVSYEILESIDNSNFFNALGVSFNDAGSPTAGNTGLSAIEIKSPFFKIKFTNQNASSRNVSLSFVSIISS